MNSQPALHPTDQILISYGLGKLDDTSAESINEHLESCPVCRSRVAEMSSDSFLGKLRDAQGRPQSTAREVSSLTGISMMDGGASTTPPPSSTPPPGLADHPDYQILRELGRGGMGVVYLAQNRLMGRKEVLKVVGSHLISRPGVLERFLREIRSAGKLHHPNIVAAHSAIRLSESLVLTMEYVEGLDLARLVKAKGPLPVAHACNFIHQAALGLQHAHERGMVHRDIKPANLILSRDGKKPIVKVLDFGLAKVTSEGQADNTLTREGQMLGTPDYIAPEQIRDAQSADIRADIYSLGCTFYYLLTGGPPFGGDNLWDLYQAHFSMDATPLNLARPEVPVELAAVVAKMMAKDPEKRFQTPGLVAEVLAPFFKKSSQSMRSSTAEASVPVQRGTKPVSPGPGTLPTEPRTSATALPTHPATSPTENKSPKIEDATGPAPLVGSSKRLARPKWLWPAVTSGTLVLALAVACGVIIRIKTSNGTIELVNLPAGAQVSVEGERVTVQRGGEESSTARSVATPKDAGENSKAHDAEPIRTADDSSRREAGSQVKATPYSDTLPNSIGMTLKLIPARPFTMGSRDDDTGAEKAEKPAHPVNIGAFYMGIHEVTQSQYQALMGINPSYFSSTGGGKNQVAGRPTDRYPVEYVTWLDAVRFCNALSEREGFPPFYEINGEAVENVEIPNKKGPGYRLPTEAEWEYACRAGTDTKYSFGDDPALLSDHGWFDQNSVRMTHPVGEKGPNKFGLYDMHGNVFEQCADLYDENFYPRSPKDDPLKSSGTGGRVIRGGSWRREPRWNRSAGRYGYTPMGREPDLGFRVVLNLSEHINDLAGSVRTGALPKPGPSNGEPKPAKKTNIDVLSESTRMPFALIKSGEFMMGSPEDDLFADQWEKPPHKVRLSPFYLGTYEVTQAQYKAVMRSNPSFFSSAGGGREAVAGQSTDDYPVENVSWLEAVQFCNALSKRDKLPLYYQLKGGKVECPNPEGAGYRLPTDAEWEYACRAGTRTRFFFGNDPRIMSQYAWIGGSSGGIVHPVGQKQPNDFGLYDMHGNVWEWCSDWSDGGYYKQSPTNDPPGPSKGTHRVMRGGCWRDEPPGCRSAKLGWGEPGGRWETAGFRVARGLTAEEAESVRQAARAGAGDDGTTVPAVGLGEELIKNPGCEELGADARIASWDVKEGSWTRESKDQPPIEGSFYFQPGSVPDAELRQDVDVSQLAEGIDKQTQSFAFAAHVRSWNQTPADTCRVIVEFLGKDRSAALDEVDSGPVASIDRWKPLEWVKVAPANTRWIRIRLISHRQNGEANDAIYDGLSLTALRPGTKNAAGGAINRSAQKGADQAPTAKGSPQELLKARGLIRSGSHFVVASEAEALDKYQRILPLMDQMAQLSDKYFRILQIENDLATAEAEHEALRRAADEANAALSKMPHGSRSNSQENQLYAEQQLYHDGLARRRDVCGEIIGKLREQRAPAGLKEELERGFMAKQPEFLKAAGELMPLLEKAKAEHRKLQDDPAVKDALDTINRSTKTAAALSPARPLQNAIDRIKQAVRAYSPETYAPKKKAKAGGTKVPHVIRKSATAPRDR